MQAGTRLEHYEIIDKIGQGGMGAVYRAEDTRLRRHVAIKVLPPELSADAERLARLEREAQLLASLSHPNVAAVYGFGGADIDDGGVRRHIAFLVMELVEGQSLHERVAAGPLPWREATEIAAGIASGLEAAHERGIVHRDLKPANVHLTNDGDVKVLDFGLAKAFDADGTSGSLELSASPTVPATRTGMILGTAAYMSPEQARGKAVDKRADIWALGCVLYEMLTGRKAFEGETISDVLAGILKEPVDFAALPPLPARLQALLERMLQKDPKLRTRDVGDVRLELQAALGDRPRAATADAAGLSWRTAVPVAAALLLAGLVAGWLVRGTPSPPAEARVLLAPDSVALGIDALAISPDGTQVAESAPPTGIRLRSLGDMAWRLLPDTQGAPALTFDVTGTRLYFARGIEVLSVGIDGSSPLVEATFEAGTQIYALYRGAAGDVQASTWLKETRIVRIPAGGGAEELWRGSLGDASRLIATTELAPGRWIAFAGVPTGSDGLVVVGTAIAEPTLILKSYRHPLHVGDGEVLAVDERGRLASARLDPATGAVVAPPVVRVEGLALLNGSVPAFDVSAGGTLAYVAGRVAEAGETLAWLDRNGGETMATARKGTHDTDSRLAPDGLSLALEVAGTETSPISVWIHDLERDVRAALTPGIRATFPVWSPDSRWVIARLGDGIEPQGLYVVPVDRSEPPRLLVAEPEGKRLLPMDWSPDAKSLLYVQSATLQRTRAADNDVWRLPVGTDGGDPEPFLATGASEIDARYSPDGRWVAYASDQSGQYEIYLRPATGGGEVRVSADGGLDPEWNPAGSELFFLRGRNLYSVEVRADNARPVGAERQVLTLPESAKGRFLLPSADGQRFVVSLFGDTQQANAVHAILNWRRDAGR
ncbi:MAG TPA: protein kinase [Vicinamibacterales bacterium]|nr:protein kinase [Vicinamibacterales bacterium]